MWQDIKFDLLFVRFETKEQALNRSLNISSWSESNNWQLVPYRKSNDYDQLRYYHDLGLEELSYTEYYIEREEMGRDLHFIGVD